MLIINCFGLLSSIYHYGQVAYVGGGFGVGIHNLLEAAVWDVPVFFGPNNQKFQEAQGLKLSGGFEINNYEEFAAQMDRLLRWIALLQMMITCRVRAARLATLSRGSRVLLIRCSLL